jgi:hypothetical protein
MRLSALVTVFVRNLLVTRDEEEEPKLAFHDCAVQVNRLIWI